jgi:hypothetical protein
MTARVGTIVETTEFSERFDKQRTKLTTRARATHSLLSFKHGSFSNASLAESSLSDGTGRHPRFCITECRHAPSMVEEDADVYVPIPVRVDSWLKCENSVRGERGRKD